MISDTMTSLDDRSVYQGISIHVLADAEESSHSVVLR
jgi:ligand-binding sensor domain-containing protein